MAHVLHRRHRGAQILVQTTQVGTDKCRLLVEIEREGAGLIFLIDREVPLIDCDSAAVERAAIEMAISNVDAITGVHDSRPPSLRQVESEGSPAVAKLPSG